MNNFRYLNPKDLNEAGRLAGKDWKSTLLFAGGTDLLGLMKDEIESPEQVINLKSLPGMRQINYQAGKGLNIGALTTITEIAEDKTIAQKYPVLSQAAQEVASPQLRNVGTLGGNLCQRPRCWYFRGEFQCLRKGGDLCYAVDGKNKHHCVIGGGPCFIVHPSDLAVALTALDAKVTIFSNRKKKQIPLNEFFILPEQDVTRETVLKPGEIVTEISVPDVNSNEVSAYHKIKERGAWDFAVVSAGVVLEKNGSAIKQGKIVLGGVAPVPWFEKNVSEKLKNFNPTEANLSALAKTALSGAEPLAMNEYKLYMARNLIRKIIGEMVA